MQLRGVEFARKLLEPLRFCFPKVVLGFMEFRGQPDFELEKRAEDVLANIAKHHFPANVGLQRGAHVSHSLEDDVTYGFYTFVADMGPGTHFNTSPDLALLRTAATYAGQYLQVPDGFSRDVQASVSPDPEMDTTQIERWFLALLANELAVSRPDMDHIDVLDVRVCNDAFQATWDKLTELLSGSQASGASEPTDSDEIEIIELIRSVGHRLTTNQMLVEFEQRGNPKAESTIKNKLGRMVRLRLLDNRQDVRPHKGYGLPEWD